MREFNPAINVKGHLYIVDLGDAPAYFDSRKFIESFKECINDVVHPFIKMALCAHSMGNPFNSTIIAFDADVLEVMDQDLLHNNLIYTWNQHWYEVEEAEKAKKNKDKETYDNFVKNGLEKKALLELEYKHPAMKELADDIKEMISEEGLSYWMTYDKGKPDYSMLVCSYSDAQDLLLLLEAVKNQDWKLAQKRASLDTAVRERIPQAIYDRIWQKEEDEPEFGDVEEKDGFDKALESFLQ